VLAYRFVELELRILILFLKKLKLSAMAKVVPKTENGLFETAYSAEFSSANMTE